MGFTLKSNVNGTKVLSMASGFNGPNDFSTYADFNTQEYIKNGVNTTLDNVIMSQRSLSSYALASDSLYDFEVVQPNKPIRSYIFDHKTFGICPDWAFRSNKMTSALSEQAWISTPASDNIIYSIYSLDVGNSTVNSSEFDILSGDGSPESPMYFKQKAGAVPRLANIVRLNGCISCVVQPVYNGETLLAPYKDQSATANETLTVAINNALEGSIFLKFAGSKRKTSSSQPPLIPLLKLEQDANNYLAIAIQPDNYLSLRYFIGGVEEAFFKSDKIFTSRVNINKFALSWSNGVLSIAANGYVEFVAALSMGNSFQPTGCTLLSPITGWLDEFSNSALIEMALYDRRLVTTELAKFTDTV